jgi:hypothetical protein
MSGGFAHKYHNSERLDQASSSFPGISSMGSGSLDSSQNETPAPKGSGDHDIPHFADLVDYLCTQKGSRMMQDYLKKAPINSINLIIENIKDNFDRLMCDSYANYFC